ncbi:unnamed protein product [Gadus morhua 'NCC']
MSRRSRPPAAPGLHPHCESCYSRRCRARPEGPGSCALAPCPLLCGAVFHLCKQEEHALLCPRQRRPCLNAAYGCPHAMPRAACAAHLASCPASVVSCSMEWARWPVDHTDPHHLGALQAEVLTEERGRREEGGGRGGALDLAMALADQRVLYSRLKMKPLYPELMEPEEEGAGGGGTKEGGVEPTTVTDGDAVATKQAAVGGLINEGAEGDKAPEEADAGQRSGTGINTEKYNLCDMMFSMEKGGCAVAERTQGAAKQEAKTSDGVMEGGPQQAPGGPQQDTGRTGHAPWQDGVLERLGEELSPAEYNMYMVHHGRMLLTFGKIQACTPREKDFVYGSLEPIPLQSLQSFKVPVSFHYKQRVQMAYDAAQRVQSEERSVDTSDLEVKEEDWHQDEADSTLLGYAELEVMGHKISDTKGTDGHYVDVGTQTHSFRTAPFRRTTTLEEVTAGGPAKLRLQLQAGSVSSRHNKATSAFTFSCGHCFHRSEFPRHFRNVHADVQTCVSGWFEQRCPLSYLGCTFSQRRFQPSTHKATVTYNQELSCFNLCPGDGPPTAPPGPPPGAQGRGRGRGPGRRDSLSGLPYEVLCHVASFLDSLSLSQLALVSRLLRDVCSSLLRDRGMVTLRWEKKTYTHGGAKWRARPVWEFSHLFSTVDTWCFADVPPISAHLRVCPYYKPSLGHQPVALAGMKERQDGPSERQTLVNQFMGNRLPL